MKIKKLLLLTIAFIILLNFIDYIPLPAYAGGFEDEDIYGEDIYDDIQQLNGLYYTISDGKATVEGCDASITGNTIIIPSVFDDYPVTSISFNAFYGCDSITSISIPNSVLDIEARAFEECYSLTSIDVDSKNAVFSSINGILFNKDKTHLICYPCGKTETSYTIPENVTNIRNRAFSNCNSLTSIIILNNNINIESYAFRDCKNLTNVEIPDSVTNIRYDTFYSTKIQADKNNWDGDVFYVGNHLIGLNIARIAAGIKPKLGDYTVLKGTTTIVSNGFYGGFTLNSIVIPESMKYIGDYAFDFCKNLNKVYYCGTEEEWNKISIKPNNKYLTSAKLYYNYGKKIDNSPTSENLVTARQVLLSDDNDLLIDYNSDHEVDVRDLVYLKKKLAGIIA